MRQRKGAQPEPWELSKEEERATSPEESPESRGFTRKQTAEEEFGMEGARHLEVDLGECSVVVIANLFYIAWVWVGVGIHGVVSMLEHL